MASGKFNLPKRREVEETDWTVVLVDVTETPIERPKKSKVPQAQRQGSDTTIAERKSVIR